jgi:hypothetical protein
VAGAFRRAAAGVCVSAATGPGRRFRVGYLSHVPHRAFLDTAAERPVLDVVRIPLDQPEEAVVAALAGCDAYYCMASRDELPKPFHVHAALLARLAGPADGGEHRRGLRPGGPGGLHGGGRAAGEPGRRQRGRRGGARGRHDAGAAEADAGGAGGHARRAGRGTATR